MKKTHSNRVHHGQSRKFSFELLEERQLLAVSLAEFEEICSTNPQIGLSSDMTQYHVIEIAADELSESALRDAIVLAIETEKDDLIVVRTSSSQNRITLSGSELAISAAKGDITIVTVGDEKLTIDADQKSRVLGIYESTVTLSGLIVTGGARAASSLGYGISGSGIFNTGFMTLVNCEVSENFSDERFGGGIFSSGIAVIKNSQILKNVSVGGGGGIYASGVLILENCVIAGNYSCLGGGISYRGHERGLLEITNCTIAGNTGDGGAIYTMIDQENSSGYDIRIQDTIISANFSQFFGPALCFDYEEDAPLLGNILLENVFFGENHVDPENFMGVDESYLLRDERIHWGSHLWGYSPQFVVPPMFDAHGRLLNADEMDLRLRETSPAIGLGAFEFQERPTQKEIFPETDADPQNPFIFLQNSRLNSLETTQEEWMLPFQYDPSMQDRFFDQDNDSDWPLWFLEWGNQPTETSMQLGCDSEFGAGIVSVMPMIENAELLDQNDKKTASNSKKDAQKQIRINRETRTSGEVKPAEKVAREYQQHPQSPESQHAAKLKLKPAG